MGFTFNGITSQSIKIKARLTSWQASPPLRNQFEIVPGKSGVADFGADTSERKISISCNIYPQKTFTDLVSVLDNLSNWVNPEKGLRQLVLDDIPDRYFMARISDSIDCNRVLRTAGTFELNFICPDPYGYAIIDEQFTITNPLGNQVIRQKGNINSDPIYLLKAEIAQATQSIIHIITNGEEIKIVGGLSASEVLVIDTGKVTAKVVDGNGNTIRNGLPNLKELNFPVLNSGLNTVTISAENATFTELKIVAKSRWR